MEQQPENYTNQQAAPATSIPTAPPPSSSQPPLQPLAQPFGPVKEPRKSKKALVITIIAVSVLIVTAAAAAVLMTRKPTTTKSNTLNKSAVVSQPCKSLPCGPGVKDGVLTIIDRYDNTNGLIAGWQKDSNDNYYSPTDQKVMIDVNQPIAVKNLPDTLSTGRGALAVNVCFGHQWMPESSPFEPYRINNGQFSVNKSSKAVSEVMASSDQKGALSFMRIDDGGGILTDPFYVSFKLGSSPNVIDFNSLVFVHEKYVNLYSSMDQLVKVSPGSTLTVRLPEGMQMRAQDDKGPNPMAYTYKVAVYSKEKTMSGVTYTVNQQGTEVYVKFGEGKELGKYTLALDKNSDWDKLAITKNEQVDTYLIETDLEFVAQ